MEYLNCQVLSEESVICNGTRYDIPETRLTYRDTWFWIYIGIYTGLVIFAGLVSGLTMGLLSLDFTTLMTIQAGGDERERRYAGRILPLVRRHHLLLVTLLLSNAVAVEAMPIFLDRVSNPIIAIVISVTAVLVFGEVIPQAVCTRYGLAIGAYMAPLVYFLMALFFVISWPFSKLLDCCLGTEHGTFYRRGQLKALIDIHGEAGGHHAEPTDTLSKDEVLIIKGCLDMRGKFARDAMMGIDTVYMLHVEAKLDYETMTQVIHRGHSRIPVWAGQRTNILGCLLTKTLIKLSPDDAVPVSSLIMDSRYSRPPLFVPAETPMFDLLNIFQTGKCHLALVREMKKRDPHDDRMLDAGGSGAGERSPLLVNIEEGEETRGDKEGEVVGIITLEDVIEELLQEEIEDEKDITREISQQIVFSMARFQRSQSMINSPDVSSSAMHRLYSHPVAMVISADVCNHRAKKGQDASPVSADDNKTEGVEQADSPISRPKICVRFY